MESASTKLCKNQQEEMQFFIAFDLPLLRLCPILISSLVKWLIRLLFPDPVTPMTAISRSSGCGLKPLLPDEDAVLEKLDIVIDVGN